MAGEHFVFVQPTATTVGNNVTITILAQDSAGNLVLSESGSVLLIATGSASPSSTLVHFVNGVGSTLIQNYMAETVLLSLVDQGTGANCSSTTSVVFLPGNVVALFSQAH